MPYSNTSNPIGNTNRPSNDDIIPLELIFKQVQLDSQSLHSPIDSSNVQNSINWSCLMQGLTDTLGITETEKLPFVPLKGVTIPQPTKPSAIHPTKTASTAIDKKNNRLMCPKCKVREIQPLPACLPCTQKEWQERHAVTSPGESERMQSSDVIDCMQDVQSASNANTNRQRNTELSKKTSIESSDGMPLSNQNNPNAIDNISTENSHLNNKRAKLNTATNKASSTHSSSSITSNASTSSAPGSKYTSKQAQQDQDEMSNLGQLYCSPPKPTDKKSSSSASSAQTAMAQDENLRHLDPKMVECIMSQVIECCNAVTWDDIAGLQHAKRTLQEIVVWPMLRPDIFTGLRGPPKGLLLFGPPGTGKTMIGKCIAAQAKATFFSISASTLTSKWFGEAEKLVRALFGVARSKQPSVIFIDEIDSILGARSDDEAESTRRIKTEFLVQFDGVGTIHSSGSGNSDAAKPKQDRILVIGATNRPQDIDEAARRRLVKRLYIALPDAEARQDIIQRLLNNQGLKHSLTTEDLKSIVEATDGYSGSDMHALCREAAMGPIRSTLRALSSNTLGSLQGARMDIDDGNIDGVGRMGGMMKATVGASHDPIADIQVDQLRGIEKQDFLDALSQVRASVSNRDLQGYLEWDQQYGSIRV